MTSPRWMTLAVFVAISAFAGGCAGSGTEGTDGPGEITETLPATTPALPVVPLTVARSGGFAGVDQAIEIDVNGNWSYRDNKSKAEEKGVLTPDQKSRLQALVSDPAFGAELTAARQTPGVCADTFQYSIGITGDKVAYDSCADPDAPTVTSLIALVAEATPF